MGKKFVGTLIYMAKQLKIIGYPSYEFRILVYRKLNTHGLLTNSTVFDINKNFNQMTDAPWPR